MKSQLFQVGGGHQSRMVDFAHFVFNVEQKSRVGFILKLPYCFWASRPSKKMRLDESFHMRYTNASKHATSDDFEAFLCLRSVCGLQNLDAILIHVSKSTSYIPIVIVIYQCFNKEPNNL